MPSICLHALPAPHPHTCNDSRLWFVGLNWSVNDERKMRSSFGWQTSEFGNFVDLARLAAGSAATYGLGARPGLATLADRVLGVAVPKNKQVPAAGVEGFRAVPAHDMWLCCICCVLSPPPAHAVLAINSPPFPDGLHIYGHCGQQPGSPCHLAD